MPRAIAMSALLASLALAACGGGDDTTTTGAAPEAAPEADGADAVSGSFRAGPVTAGPPGAAVIAVEQGTPIEAAGLRRGDVITKVDGERMTSPDQIAAFFRGVPEAHEPFEKVSITVLRGAQVKEVELTLVLAADVLLGAEIPTGEGKGNGARVVSADRHSPAGEAGLEPGDLVTGVDDQAVATPEDLLRALAEYRPGDEVELAVTRGSDELSLTATLEARIQRPAG